MKTFKIQVPNDYNSEIDIATAIIDCYAGDEEAFKNDNSQQLYEAIAYSAKEAGLIFIKSTDFGATWSGTDAQFTNCVELLPAWAKRYASKIEKRGGRRSGSGRKSTGKAMAMFYLRVPAELKKALANINHDKIRMALSKIDN